MGDNFHAHVDATSLEGTLFTERVAHGYCILSEAAGMFVDPRKGPVLLNYGPDECRFTKPVYPGMTIGVTLTVRTRVLDRQGPGARRTSASRCSYRFNKQRGAWLCWC
ncbi:MaoC/PaaZ C-terminal domain-containing protein [Hymenobacter ruricola]|uniref:MaoC/PaaZ C-terminal domain-containing protein n=1 Tax=Hymenobacter ruricola TaxID=2791023 RepID=UPI001E3B6DE6|nr:MaoC/PaaZ C-terminal domain-containing protein [Hymenobacter ruricola]